MIGRLPRLYRWRTVAIALVACVGVGAWLAASTPVPVVAPVGALVGGLAGALLAFVLLHDFSHHRAHPVRVRRR